MLIVKNKANITIQYPLEKIARLDKILFFDIETTGFSRTYCNVYLIGCMYFSNGIPMYAQWLAENFNDEADILMAFHKFMQDFDTIIHFNGNSFDIPFLVARGEKYHLNFNFDRFQNIDIYKPLSKLNHILKLENQKQKTFEKYLNINRTDPFSGADLIEVFRHYVETKDERLILPLLLHNQEDVINMGHLLALLSISDLFEKKFTVVDFFIRDFENMNGDMNQELCIRAVLDSAVPVPISYHCKDVSCKAENMDLHIVTRIQSGTYKYYFDKYEDYYYLPLEDKAIHKSVGTFVDSKFRKQATRSTCYEKFSGNFLPVFDLNHSEFSTIFKENQKDNFGYIKADSIDTSNIFIYVSMIMDYIKKRPKK